MFSQRLPPSVYEPENDKKCFLSLDLKDANFNALILYDPQLAKVIPSHLVPQPDTKFTSSGRYIVELDATRAL